MRLLPYCLLAIFSAACSFLVPKTAGAECSMNRAALLPLVLWDQKLVVVAEVNGTRVPFIVDTGASVTTLSEHLARSLNLPRDFDHVADMFGVGGMESHLYIAQTHDFDLAGVHLAGRSFPVADFADRTADGTPLGGLIGADILSRFDVDLDLPGRRLGLWRTTGCSEVRPDWPGDSAETALEIATTRHVSVPVRINGAALDLMLDTGSPGLVLSTRAAARAGAPPEILEQNRQLVGHGVNDRPFSAWFHIFQRLDVAGQVFGDVGGVVVSPGRIQTGDGLLGLEFFKRGRVWISYGTGKFFVQKTAAAY